MARVAFALALACNAAAYSTEQQAAMNPIRKVVTMLQAMQKKVEKEGEVEKTLFDKFMCHCKTGGGDLAASISAAEAKAPELGSSIEAAEGKLAQAKADLESAQADRIAAKSTVAEATALREKEAAAFAKEKAEFDTNIAAINKAVAALEKGMAGSFVQTSAAQVLRNLATSSQDMLDADRQELVAFLSQGSSYAPSSGEVTGILKQLGEEMSKNLAEIESSEASAIKSFEEMVAAKKKEIESLSATVETKTQQIGELGVEIVQMKEDLSDTQAALLEDKKYLADLETSCATKKGEWEERSKTRAEELVALADTIKILNDDDALDLFKSTLPGSSASLLQVRATAVAQRSRALAMVRTARASAASQARPGLDFLALALSGKRALNQGGFEKVIKMIESMVEELHKEQKHDDDKQEYCKTQFDATEDKQKALERAVSDAETAIADTKEKIATATDEIAALEKGIKALDKAVAEATEQRQEENSDYKSLMSSNGAAKELLAFAKNRLNKFYNPKLHKSAPKVELTEAERITVNMGGTAPPTAAPGGIAGTGIAAFAQVSAHVQRKDAPAPPPETWGAYQKKSEESNGVIAMVDLLVKDLDKEMTEASTEEKNAQADYERLMADSAEKRATDSKSLAEKGSAKADMEAQLEAHGDAKKASAAELMAVMRYTQSLHAECDWLLQYHEVRKTARADEIDSLKKAKAVLSGADFSLVQTRSRGYLRRSA